MTAATSIQQVFAELETATDAFFAGDPAPVLAWWSHADDVSMFGGAGAYAQGWTSVKPGIEWAAAHFRGGHGTRELVAMGESGDLAYTTYIERIEIRVEGSDEPSAIAFRITQIYRREQGDWKIIHRHADPRVERGDAAWQ